MATVEERVSQVEREVSHTNGVLEQMNVRLGNLESGQQQMRAETLQRMDSQFRWVMVLLFTILLGIASIVASGFLS